MIPIMFSVSQIFALLTITPASCVSSISGFLTAPYTAWFPVVVLATLAVLSVLAIVYALAPLLGTGGGFRAWTKVKIYEILVSLILVLIFASFSTVICTFDPTPSLSSVGLVSSACMNSGGTGGSNIYSVATCNLHQFNYYAQQLIRYVYYVQVLFALQPSFGATFQLGAGQFSASASISDLEIAPFSFLAGSAVGGSLGNLGDAIVPLAYVFVLLNQLQLILLSAAPLIFALFMAIGLIARAFGVTRTFGGSMIAFALGLGFVYPLLIAVNYGFINYVIEQAQFPGGILVALPASNPVVILAGVLSTAVFGTSNFVSLIPEYFFVWFGMVFVGLVFVDMLNFIILETFISDFSQALGERMSFMSIIQNII